MPLVEQMLLVLVGALAADPMLENIPAMPRAFGMCRIFAAEIERSRRFFDAFLLVEDGNTHALTVLYKALFFT